jgi:hypothetical protein
MKRYGIEATREALKNGAFIRAWDFYTLNAGYKITTEGGEILGFITCDLFSKLLKNGEIVKTASAYSYKDYAAPVIIDIEEIDDESDEQPEAPTMDTPDTIQPKVAYSVHFPKLKTATPDSDSERVLLDGGVFVMRCKRREYSDFIDDMRQNECFNLCEIFSTAGAKWAYWRDEEADEDYITKIGNYSDIINAFLVVNGKIYELTDITQREYLTIKKTGIWGNSRVCIFRTEEEAQGFIKEGGAKK